MIEIFATNVNNQSHAAKVIKELELCFPELKMNFDLEKESTILFPCEHNVLRIEGEKIDDATIVSKLIDLGYKCYKIDSTICD